MWRSQSFDSSSSLKYILVGSSLVCAANRAIDRGVNPARIAFHITDKLAQLPHHFPQELSSPLPLSSSHERPIPSQKYSQNVEHTSPVIIRWRYVSFPQFKPRRERELNECCTDILQRFLRRKPPPKTHPPPQRRTPHPPRLPPNLRRPPRRHAFHSRRRPQPHQPHVPRPYLRSRLHSCSYGSGEYVLG